MSQKVGIILKKCKICFRIQMLFKKVWTYDVIFKNTCLNINRLLFWNSWLLCQWGFWSE